jgi:uncharacterized Zn finger protein
LKESKVADNRIFRDNVTSFADPSVEYEVTFYPDTNTYECSCPNFKYRSKEIKMKCKHINKAIYGVNSDMKLGE